MYYSMEQAYDDEDCYVVGSLPDVTPPSPWYRADRFEESPKGPLRFELDPRSGPVMPDFFDAGIPVFSQALCDAFREAGVDNFEAYEAIMADPRSGRQWPGYYAINVIGKVRCADAEKSVGRDPTGSGLITVFYNRLIVDESRIRGLLCFRLAESLGELIVHEKVVRCVQRRGLRSIRFTRVSPEAEQ